MELFSGGGEGFPQPFSELTAMIEATEESMMRPPQKLRPIRYNGTSRAEEFAEAIELMGDDLCAINGDSFDYITPPIKAESCGDDPSGSSSDSDDDDDDFSATINEPVKKKRKRKRREKIEVLLEKLVMKVMDKQEEMHMQLMEMIEKRERERIIREEAWKRQEMERIKRDEEARAQETSRSLALISFIQNVLGHEIQIPIPLTMSCMEENGSEHHMVNPFGQGGTRQANRGENHVDRDAGVNCDTNNRRWPDAEVQTLIMLRSNMEHKFHVTGSKCSIWDEISAEMHNMGYSRSAKKCKEKWENINKYFRKSVGSGKRHHENSKRCTYFHDLHLLYKNGFGTSLNHMNCTKVDNALNHMNCTKVDNADNGESLKGNEC